MGSTFSILVSMFGLILVFLIGIIVKQTILENKIEKHIIPQTEYNREGICRLERMHDLPPLAVNLITGEVLSHETEIAKHPPVPPQ